VRSKGKVTAGMSTKFHLAITNLGQPVEGFLTGGETADIKAAEESVEDVFGFPIIADRGYDGDKFRDALSGNNNIPVIPGRMNRMREIVYDERLYKKRGLIDGIFGSMKENRRLALRFEKSDANFLGFIFFALIKKLL
jgi:transposase